MIFRARLAAYEALSNFAGCMWSLAEKLAQRVDPAPGVDETIRVDIGKESHSSPRANGFDPEKLRERLPDISLSLHDGNLVGLFLLRVLSTQDEEEADVDIEVALPREVWPAVSRTVRDFIEAGDSYYAGL